MPRGQRRSVLRYQWAIDNQQLPDALTQGSAIIDFVTMGLLTHHSGMMYITVLQDFLVMMQVVFGDELMQQADAATMNRLQVVAGEADLAPAGADDDE